MSETLLMIVGAAALVGVAWIVWRAARSRSDAGDGGGIIYDGSSNSSSGSNCGGFGGDGGCDGGSDGGGGD